ncbi:hypothetical protein HanRHA438_Chr16g0745951 [Helianthus annuus]|nr:hypothetical protein HanRHA438_Chr16g0745951 [Helianthus annuus]
MGSFLFSISLFNFILVQILSFRFTDYKFYRRFTPSGMTFRMVLLEMVQVVVAGGWGGYIRSG